MARTPRPRVFEYRLEANTTEAQSTAVDQAFPGQLADRATKIRILVDLGLKSIGVIPVNGHKHQSAAE